MLTGEWIEDDRARLASSSSTGAERYHSAEARRMEKQARTKRLFLAYSEKRLARARDARAQMQPQPELAFIPLDPVIESDDLEDDSVSDAGTSLLRTDLENTEQYLVTRNKLFASKLAENPKDVDTWLDLMAFQEDLARLTSSNSKNKALTTTGIIEKQQAILKKALVANPGNPELQRVQMNMTLLLSSDGDHDRIKADIEDKLATDTRNDRLWLKLVTLTQEKFSAFSMPAMRDLFARIIALIEKELIEVLKSLSLETQRNSVSSVQIFGKNSLLAKSEDLYVASSCQNQVVCDLSQKLLMFHSLACELEAKAGYVERAVAYTQALVYFNINLTNKIKENDRLRLGQAFMAEWSGECPRLGYDQTSTSFSQLFVPERTRFDEFLRSHVTAIADLSPPPAIRTLEHVSKLRSNADDITRCGIGDEKTQDAMSVNTSLGTDEAQLVYSNLHGYRIRVEQTNDAGWYERILEELRGTEESKTRREMRQRKAEVRQARQQSAAERVRDERADYDDVAQEEHYACWLQLEERLEAEQWTPLHSSNPLHADAIEAQPDRAVMPDEIQPFLFRIPVPYRCNLVQQVLHYLGVQRRASTEEVPQLYADKFTDLDAIVEPILRSFGLEYVHANLSSGVSWLKSLSSAVMCEVDVDKRAIYDPERVKFIRHVMEQAITLLDGAHARLIKCLWIEYESALLQSVEHVDSTAVAKARELVQHLLAQDNQTPDVSIMFAYAKMELLQQQHRQVNRICDKTLAAIGSNLFGSIRTPRDYHKLVFVRARNELWLVTDKSVADGLLRCQYIMWSVGNVGIASLDTIVKQHKKRSAEELRRILTASVALELESKYRLDVDVAHDQCQQGGECNTLTCAVGYSLHNLCLAVYSTKGFIAARNEFEAFINSATYQVHSASVRRWIFACYLEFIRLHAQSQRLPMVSPREWRNCVAQAVSVFPTDALFLRLFVDAETGNTMSQTLRKHFADVKKRWRRHFDSPSVVEWLFAVLCEVQRLDRAASHGEERGPACCLLHKWKGNLTGIARLRSVLEEMVESVQTRGSALAWRLYLRFEVAMGKIEAARKVFYRAIAHCPWSKALYLDGIRVLRPYLSSDECQELMGFLAAKELHVRADE
ncbi:TPA: hypothetical protein N0F65_002019 [Lagenidium giganteum]|uniref:Uncharacterized protein n=1 Tax=Lagenidium giganteum TaxID=4803 RepID=A0AAV2Z134_9STRA|nr:TPA: hypothetical protein N0F65_002019 [Lagenidium giganteum]